METRAAVEWFLSVDTKDLGPIYSSVDTKDLYIYIGL